MSPPPTPQPAPSPFCLSVLQNWFLGRRVPVWDSDLFGTVTPRVASVTLGIVFSKVPGPAGMLTSRSCWGEGWRGGTSKRRPVVPAPSGAQVVLVSCFDLLSSSNENQTHCVYCWFSKAILIFMSFGRWNGLLTETIFEPLWQHICMLCLFLHP